jgi:hypothetical protein
VDRIDIHVKYQIVLISLDFSAFPCAKVNASIINLPRHGNGGIFDRAKPQRQITVTSASREAHAVTK